MKMKSTFKFLFFKYNFAMTQNKIKSRSVHNLYCFIILKNKKNKIVFKIEKDDMIFSLFFFLFFNFIPSRDFSSTKKK